MHLHVSLTNRKDLSGQVYRQFRDAILDGRLRARDPLPSSRNLAKQLRLSRNTVLLAYDRLRAEGFLTSTVGAGTFVAPGIQPRARVARVASPLRARPVWENLPEGLDMAATQPAFDFRPGIPDVSAFPFPAWRARMAQQFQPLAVGSGAHIGAAGHEGLRAAIARHVGVARAVRAAPEDVIVTSGSQQALDIIIRVLLEPGDTIAMEDPGYPVARRAFLAHGCRVADVPVDAEGLVVEAIPRRARLVYVTPSHQYPLGMAMSMVRRQALLAWAQRANGIVVEDDYDSEFRFGGRPLEPLQSLDSSGRVLYVGSLSKVMLPTLRLGFLVAPPSLGSALRKAKHITDWHTAVATQAAAASFIEDGLLVQYVRRMRRVYEERQELIRRVLDRDFKGRLTPLPSSGGLHLAARLDGLRGAADVALAEEARRLGVEVFPLSRHHQSSHPHPGFIIGYGAIATERIELGLLELRRCLPVRSGRSGPAVSSTAGSNGSPR